MRLVQEYVEFFGSSKFFRGFIYTCIIVVLLSIWNARVNRNEFDRDQTEQLDRIESKLDKILDGNNKK